MQQLVTEWVTEEVKKSGGDLENSVFLPGVEDEDVGISRKKNDMAIDVGHEIEVFVAFF